MTESRKRCYHIKNIPLKRVRDFPPSTLFPVVQTQCAAYLRVVLKTELKSRVAVNYAVFSLSGKPRLIKLFLINSDLEIF